MVNDDILRVKAHERLSDSLQVAEGIDRVQNDSPNIQVKGKQASSKSFFQDSSSTKDILNIKNIMVGPDDEKERLLQELTRGFSGELKVIPIIGMGGIGKSTIAKEVYNDVSILHHFDFHAWATVTQQHDVKGILLSLLHSTIKLDNGDNMKDEAKLADMLPKSLKGGEWNIGEEDTFENLKYLELEEVTLAKWEFGEESFPMIEKLVQWKCHMLEEIPPSFGDICSLKIIKLVKSPQLEYSARKIKEYVEAMMRGDELQVAPLSPLMNRSLLSSFYSIRNEAPFTQIHITKSNAVRINARVISGATSLVMQKTQILLPLYLPSGVVHVEQQVDAQQVELNLINSPISLRRLLLLFQLLSYPEVDAPALASRDISLGYVPKSSKRNRKVTTSTRSSRL
ncbi:hypothetical protein CQW23_13539 [Capsicum baccatum]|uniref:NB-ARC domain-containing protein n=1 Tax=Capsicum baccatum TaxID=33114 RepID=A0A2G2WGM2_CAPBA|nr:hypothetical protein CQW23_13539 [Capsicum baccatum]